MRKTIFAVCIAFCLLSTGCGNVTNQEAETPSAATTKTATEASTETTGTSVEATTEITETSVETTAEETAQTTAEVSAEITAEPTSTNVLDSEPQSSTDQTAPTTEQAQDMISERYSAIVGGSSPIYIDADDGLYMKDSAKGFYIFSDTELNIERKLRISVS